MTSVIDGRTFFGATGAVLLATPLAAPAPVSNVASFAVALGAGLLIGIERERRKGVGADRALAGVRTFTLTSLAGALAQALQQPLLVAAGAALIVVLIAIAYQRDRPNDPGVTGEGFV